MIITSILLACEHFSCPCDLCAKYLANINQNKRGGAEWEERATERRERERERESGEGGRLVEGEEEFRR